ncbi:hypothetical protein HO173_005772 [Letharia columbiana]|uniref:Uncharacterized protein n=1 Tax=Letharia columbiana TaxID=112416 RepID=A0A8H6FWK5_9LECA|nr:uncharacterized protein HO173_005772 [Letharia columbiana]KAF6236143.1 hypothetical protein HO173_005772 [Letharia columbiana]
MGIKPLTDWLLIEKSSSSPYLRPVMQDVSTRECRGHKRYQSFKWFPRVYPLTRLSPRKRCWNGQRQKVVGAIAKLIKVKGRMSEKSSLFGLQFRGSPLSSHPRCSEFVTKKMNKWAEGFGLVLFPAEAFPAAWGRFSCVHQPGRLAQMINYHYWCQATEDPCWMMIDLKLYYGMLMKPSVAVAIKG